MKSIKSIILSSAVLNYILLAFLFPTGLNGVVPGYKMIGTAVVWSGVILAAIRSYIQLHITKSSNGKKMFIRQILIPTLYFAYCLIDTFVIRGSNISGFQRLIAHPIIFFSVYCESNNNIKNLSRKIVQVLIAILIFNLVLTWLLRENLPSNTVFIGHVQTVAQYGLISIFFGLLNGKYNKNMSATSFMLIVLAILTMILTDALTANVIAVFIIISYLAGASKKIKLFSRKTIYYIIVGAVLSVFVLYNAITNVTTKRYADYLDLSGRQFVWSSSVELVKESPITGYGVEGFDIPVFWNVWNGIQGMTYAHNQILQSVLDGGIILVILFYVMAVHSTNKVAKINDKEIVSVINMTMFAFMLDMVVESVTFYPYYYIFLAIVLSLCCRSNEVVKDDK